MSRLGDWITRTYDDNAKRRPAEDTETIRLYQVHQAHKPVSPGGPKCPKCGTAWSVIVDGARLVGKL